MKTRQRSNGWLLVSGSLILTVLTGAAADIHVAPDGSNVSPFADWATAATDVKTAVDLANTYNNSSTVWISNGVYTVGTAITIDKNTQVRGYGGDRAAVVINGGGAIRPFYLNHASAVLADLTVSNGLAAVASLTGNGGGVNLNMAGALLTNCVVTHCTAEATGGGVYMLKGGAQDCLIACNTALGTGAGTVGGLYVGPNMQACNVVISNNTAETVVSCAGGVYLAMHAFLHDSLVVGNFGIRAGGVYNRGGGLTYCTIIDNVASNGATPNTSNGNAGAIYSDSYGLLVRNCLIWRNSGHSGYRGAGGIWGNKRNDYAGTVEIESCTIVSNSYHGVGTTGSGSGGYFFSGSNFVTGCIVYHNQAPSATWRDIGINSADRYTTNFYAYTCAQYSASALPVTQGNITADPLFVDFHGENYQLTKGSPCVNAGTNLAWMVGALDFGGNPRIDVHNGGVVDMGAFEYTVGPPPGTTLIVR